MGSVVTVIADAKVWWPDPMAMKAAGRDYLLGFAAARRAFHPKLMLMVGAETALAAIGSGNVTLGGWQYNSELWRLLRADREGASPALADLTDWLDNVTACVSLARPHRSAVERVSRLLRKLVDRLPRTAGSERVLPLDKSVLNLLPEGPVDELTLVAPFYDPETSAVKTLLDQLRPATVTVVLQEGRSVVDTSRLAAVLAESDAHVKVLNDHSPTFRHAKLVEWRIGPRRWA